MNIVDSSAWLEYFAGTKNAGNFARAIETPETLLIPSVILYEVFKKIMAEKGEDEAIKIIAHMKTGHVVALDLEISLRAAKLSNEHKIPMADSIILATAQKHKAILWTQDADFKGLQGVRYFERK